MPFLFINFVPVTALDFYKQEDFTTVPEPVLAVLETLPALRLTIWEGAEVLMPVQDIGKLALQEVAKLYTVSTLSTPFWNALLQRSEATQGKCSKHVACFKLSLP